MKAGTGQRPFKAMVSTDWNECLSPMGPFDPFIFAYPDIKEELERIFKEYTSNKMPLSKAMNLLKDICPRALTQKQMDSYLEKKFATYTGVSELIEWCKRNDVFFMINTTASIGFFQRVLARGLLPPISALSAHPAFRYGHCKTDPDMLFELLEITDKPVNTKKAADLRLIPYEKIVIIGDSGGDGPHFEWGAENGAFLVGSMTKWSLEGYCKDRGIQIDHYIGPCYAVDEKRDIEREMATDFDQLKDIIRRILLR